MKPSTRSAHRTLNFLEQNPSISASLFAECDHDLDHLTTLIEPVLEASRRCEIASSYIQAVTTGRTTFLATNLPYNQTVQLTEIASSWLVGRSSTCAIAVHNACISRCHAAIGYYDSGDFYITDIGSSNGTWVNRRRLMPLERRILRDGDLIEFGSFKVEFFVINAQESTLPANDITNF